MEEIKTGTALITAFALLMMLTADAKATGVLGEQCKGQCNHAAKTCRFDGCIPKDVPDFVNNIDLVDVQPTDLKEGIFCNLNWKNVIKLTIRCDRSCNAIGSISDNVFKCLENISTLQLNLKKWSIAGTKPFTGLPNLSVLDLTGCYEICSNDIITILSDRNQVPSVTELVLGGISTTCRPEPVFLVNQTFTDLIALRNITTLNLSSTSIRFDYIDIICTALSTLNLSKAVVANAHKLENQRPCKSLRVLDISDQKLAFDAFLRAKFNFTNKVYSVGEKHYPSLYKSISTFYLNRLMSDSHCVYIQNVSVSILPENNMKELYLSGYCIPVLDLQIHLSHNHLETIVISDNKIQTLGSKIFQNLSLLRVIDISYNKLTSNFSKLFQKNNQLVELNAANNEIDFLSGDAFLSNTFMEKLDLSGNKLKQITFELSQLACLQMLDMQNNSIVILDAMSRNSLDKLTRRKTNSSSSVDLRGNHFSCDCRSLEFLRWVASSPIFLSTRHLYYCNTTKQRFAITNGAVEEAENDCERPKRKLRKILLASVLPTSGTIIAALVVICFLKKRRERLRLQHIEERFRLIQDGDFHLKFIAFLSFSSEDGQFVETNILQPLTDHFEMMFGEQRDLICIGDRYFRLGRTIYSEMTRCLDDCAVFIAVMSRNYCNSEYCRLEIEEARVKRMPIILIFIEEVDERDMSQVIREVFKNYTRTKFSLDNGQYRLQPDWYNVCESVVQLVEFNDTEPA